jgi:hypothetical protein
MTGGLLVIGSALLIISVLSHRLEGPLKIGLQGIELTLGRRLEEANHEVARRKLPQIEDFR